jgi:hypothetical protein
MREKETISYVTAIAAAILVTVMLRGLVPPGMALGLGWLAMLLVGYPFTRFVTGNRRLGFARWAVASLIGAAVSVVLSALF